MNPYIRQVEVTLDQVPTGKRGDNVVQTLTYKGDGTQNGIRIRFNIFQQVQTTGQPSTIQLYNLSSSTRNLLKQDTGIIITVKAGWENTGISTIFQGSLLAAVHQREGADIVTTLYSLADFVALSKTMVSVSLTGGFYVEDIVKMYATTLHEKFGVSIDLNKINVKVASFGNQGYTFHGCITDALDTLARVYGFSWCIHNGTFQALRDDVAFPTSVVISSKNGLLRAEPQLSTMLQRQSGLNIQCLLNPNIDVGHMIKLESALNDKLNGFHKVCTLTHSGDTHSHNWTTNIESWQLTDFGGGQNGQ